MTKDYKVRLLKKAIEFLSTERYICYALARADCVFNDRNTFIDVYGDFESEDYMEQYDFDPYKIFPEMFNYTDDSKEYCLDGNAWDTIKIGDVVHVLTLTNMEEFLNLKTYVLKEILEIYEVQEESSVA